MLSLAFAKWNMAREAACLRDLKSVRRLQARFRYTPNNSYGYPSIERVFQNQLCGDCASASVLGKWSLSQIGVSNHIYILSSTRYSIGHSIVINDDHSIVVSKVSVVEIDPHVFPASVYALWNNSYDSMRLYI